MILPGYKRKQGKTARQISLCAASGCLSWILIQFSSLFVVRQAGTFWLALCVLEIVLSLVVSLLILEKPRAADFLISVQSEVDRITWPSSEEVKRATLVVLVLITSMACTIFAFDMLWQWVFQVIGFLQIHRR
ncbi:MAG: preprotein translocase subunit SecE [Planctomycetota bacterium]